MWNLHDIKSEFLFLKLEINTHNIQCFLNGGLAPRRDLDHKILTPKY